MDLLSPGSHSVPSVSCNGPRSHIKLIVSVYSLAVVYVFGQLWLSWLDPVRWASGTTWDGCYGDLVARLSLDGTKCHLPFKTLSFFSNCSVECVVWFLVKCFVLFLWQNVLIL